jgi:hypothetical protein
MKRRLRSRIDLLKNKTHSTKFTTKLIFFFVGISSTIWFLARVIPKPQRAGYPCMRAAAPLMSAFVLYLISLGGSVLFFRKAIRKFRQGRYIIASLALIVSLGLIVYFTINDAEDVLADNTDVTWSRGEFPDAPNTVIGEGWGIFPGRVAWVHNPDATNEFCDNVVKLTGGWSNQVMDMVNSDSYTMPKNNDQDVINEMADKSVIAIGGQPTVKDSWDAIFKSFNNKRKGIDAGYTEGQTIFIKVNNGQAGWAINNADLSEKGNTSQMTGVRDAAMSGTTPATVLAYVRQLVDEVGVPQNKIYIAEPMTHVYKTMYDAIHNEYPNVIVLDKERSDLGRKKTSGWVSNAVKYSDKGSAMPNGIRDALMNEMYNADYLINIAALKAHARNGVTLTAKLHFGSHGDHGGNDWGSFDLHDGLIATVNNDVLNQGVRGEYGMYRVLTDFMGHEKLGLNTVLFVVDGLWGGVEATDMPVWWYMDPFNGDFPNSLFVSQDAVALECVCIDFLRAEADINDDFNDRPFFPAVDDHLRQAASKDYWAEGITYDPEGDGTEIPASIGVYEHWNNDYDKQYSKNLDPNASGIELYTPDDQTSVKQIQNVIQNINVFPNPCTDYAEINFSLEKDAMVEFSVVSATGQIIQKYIPEQQFAGMQSFKLNTSTWLNGNYIIVMKSKTNSGTEINSAKLVVN